MTQAESWDKSYFITGAASGIGRALSERLAAPGTLLILHTRNNQAGLERVAGRARENGAETVLLMGDLAHGADCQRLAEAVLERAPGLDGFAAVAGFADATDFTALDRGTLENSWNAITAAFADLVRGLHPALQARRGRVVAVSSFVAHRAIDRTLPASASAKAGLEALVRSFAYRLAADGIAVNAVVPGYIEKDPEAHRAISADAFQRAIARIPQGRLGRPEDVAAAIGFLLSREADYVTGQLLHVDGGLTL